MTPPYLKPGDKVGIVSTAKQAESDEIAAGLGALKSWELEPVIGANAFKKDGFLAGTDAERANDLQQMLDDDSIKAVFFTKGGYGTLRIIDSIDFTKFRKNPKWIIGYSDITLLHSHIHNFGIQTIHAVMVQGMGKSTAESSETIRKAVFGESLGYEFPAEAENRITEKTIEGTLIGGNLSMLYAILASESDMDFTDKILFIEDIDEYLYHYDRMMISLKRAGKLKGLKGILVGAMVDIKESTIPFGRNERQITLEHTEEYGYPVYFGLPSGHVTNNRALIMGGKVIITSDRNLVKVDFLHD